MTPSMEGGVPEEKIAPEASEEQSDFWTEKSREWGTIFQTADVSGRAVSWSRTPEGPGPEKFLQEVDGLVADLSHDEDVRPLLKNYRFFVDGSGSGSVVMKDALRVSGMDLVQQGHAWMAENLLPHVRAQEGFTSQGDALSETTEEKEQGDLKVGDFAMWEAGGTLRFDQPKQILEMQIDPGSKKKYAFFDNPPTTGVPMDELVIAEKPNEEHRQPEPEIEPTPLPIVEGPVVKIPVKKTEPEPLVMQAEKKEQILDLDTARNEYVKAHKKYLENNKKNPGAVLQIGGDTTVVAAARKVYDEALKAASEAERQKILAGKYSAASEMPPLERANVNKVLFEKFVVAEEKRLAELKVSGMPPKEESWYKRTWMQYASLPRWQKIAISTAIGTGVAAGAGAVAGMGVLYYAGRRAISPLIAGAAGAGTTIGLEAWDKTFGKKQTKEYQIDALLQKRTNDILQSLDDMTLEYRDILEKQADREKKRMYLKIAVAALAGAGTSVGVGLALEHHIPTGGASAADHHVTTNIAKPEGMHDVSHPADHPAGQESMAVPKPEAVAIPKIIDHPAIEVKEGDSLWRITAQELQKEDGFDTLNDAQKTWMISSVVDRAIEHKDVVGFSDADAIAIHTKLDLSSLLKGEDVHSLLEKAGHLSEEQQANILANNHTVAEWLHAHPHEQLTGSRVHEIVKGPQHPTEVAHTTVDQELPPQVGNVPGVAAPEHYAPIIPPRYTMSSAAFEKLIQDAPVDPAKGELLLYRLHDVSEATPAEVNHMLLTAAQKVGDHHPINVDPGDINAVTRQMRDYLVLYPKMQQGFDFKNYDAWAGVRDLSAKKFVEEATASQDLKSALRHSFWHRGAHIHEIYGGKLHKVSLEPRHVNLGMALRTSGLPENVPEDLTVGEYLNLNSSVVNNHEAAVLFSKLEAPK